MTTKTKTKDTSMGTAKGKSASASERILAIDVGGTGLKAAMIDAEGNMKSDRVKVPTPHPCPPDVLVESLVKLVEPLCKADPPTHISMGFPGVVRNNHVLTAPNLGNDDWRDIPLADLLSEHLGHLQVRIINDAEMQGFAAIRGKGLEFVLTLGTGAGTALFRDGELMPHLELAHHPVSKDKTYDEYIGNAARSKVGNKKWNSRVERVIEILSSLVNYDHLWIGGGNAANLKFTLPENVSIVSNDAGIEGGARLWHPRSMRETRQLPAANLGTGAFE
jgi:polyphosphate glucokinase